MRVRTDALSRFAFAVATCLDAGLLPNRALELSAGAALSPKLAWAARRAAEDCTRGLPISDGLARWGGRLPHFVVPVIRAGEAGGRQSQAFQLIHEHCQRLKPALELIRKAWLYPLILIITGWSLQLAVFMAFGRAGMAAAFFLDTFVKAAVLAGLGWLLLKVRMIQRGVDFLLLSLPVIRETILRQGIVLFFSTLRLVYDAGGGLSVVQMFDLALRAVGNTALRSDLERAREVVERYGSLDEAFQAPSLLDDSIKSTLSTAASAGQLTVALEQIVRTETSALEASLGTFSGILQRLIAYAVAMSIAGTILTCVLYSK